MADIQSQMPVKITDGVDTVGISNGALVVDGSGVVQPVSVSGNVLTVVGEVSSGIVAFYGTTANVAKNANTTITYTVTAGKTLYLKQIHASGSDKIKVVVTYASSQTACVGFTSATYPNFDIQFAQPIMVAGGATVNVQILNMGGATQDVYASIYGREI